ncbi:hypothetical protein [Halobacillus sp. B23F22_1]|uniref:hypothetical protein n=1 Tax=Halobacillus sp. B23F22_1 TaxID=3459514 RepID=UPI00373F296C
MNELFELIFSNFLIVAAIIGGLISWFSGMNKEDSEKQGGAPKQPKPTRTPSGPMQQKPVRGSMDKAQDLQRQSREVAQDTKGRIEDYYEQKQKRLDEMSDYQGERTQESFTFDEKDLNKNKMEVFVQEEPNTKKTSLKYSTKFNRNRLAEGIVMSEILGQPRAYKPHSSHPRKR